MRTRTISAAAIILVALAAMAQAPAAKPGILKPDELKTMMPESVFYHGQKAPLNPRNVAGVRLEDGKLVLAGLVDTSGYSSDIAEKFQGALIADGKMKVGTATLAPGVYGCGFFGGEFVMMDVGGNEIASTEETMDTKLLRPRPLMITGPDHGTYRLYFGKRYVTLTVAP
jgi:hypothetical protein